MVPIGEADWVVRPYGYYDTFAGAEQQKEQFPVAHTTEEAGLLLRFLLGQETSEKAKETYEAARKLSAEQISNQANLQRLTNQRRRFRSENWPMLARNYAHSVFYQIDLLDAANDFVEGQLALPDPLPEHTDLMRRIHDAMFRSEVEHRREQGGEENANRAFSLLREGLTAEATAHKQHPQMAVQSDQIVWGRSPVRIDIAGGWTDTPPFCLMEGGNVVNLAIELNGQPPLQAYVKPCIEPHIILRSIDLGASETKQSF